MTEFWLWLVYWLGVGILTLGMTWKAIKDDDPQMGPALVLAYMFFSLAWPLYLPIFLSLGILHLLANLWERRVK